MGNRDDMTQTPPRATTVSAPAYDHATDELWQYVDYSGALYRVHWSVSGNLPDLDGFPHLQGCRVDSVEMTAAMSRAWRRSVHMDIGAHSFVRYDSLEKVLPIVKIAHPDPTTRSLLQHEFRMMKLAAASRLPILLFQDLPLSDEHGIYGYRMERLCKIDFQRLADYAGQVEAAIDRFHHVGISHGDIHPGNIMLDRRGRIKLIDLSYSGQIGHLVPSCIPSYIYNLPTFHEQADRERMERCFPHSTSKRPRDTITYLPSPISLHRSESSGEITIS